MMCAVCNKTIHDECEYKFNRRYYANSCPVCGQVNPIYYKYKV
jgi:transcription elongation factor Elf1